VISIENIK
jgi:hypothetical protein